MWATTCREATLAKAATTNGGTRYSSTLLTCRVVNCYIVNKVTAVQLAKEACSHLQFQFQLADELSWPWRLEWGAVSQFRLALPGVHGLVRTGQRRKCHFCRGASQINLVCPQCGGVFLHGGDCFQRNHYNLRR